MREGLLALVLAPLALVTAVASAAVARSPAAFPSAPPPGMTGGFGEPTCQSCHFDFALNAGSGAVELRGVPESGYAPGTAYRVTVLVRQAGMQRGGFEVTARYEGGERAGQAAGRWRVLDDRASITTGAGALPYVHHTEAGTQPGPDSASWTVEWTAPEDAAPVVFHVAANAADGDASQFGDYVYARGFVRAGRR